MVAVDVVVPNVVGNGAVGGGGCSGDGHKVEGLEGGANALASSVVDADREGFELKQKRRRMFNYC